jgi:hypothetical protein
MTGWMSQRIALSRLFKLCQAGSNAFAPSLGLFLLVKSVSRDTIFVALSLLRERRSYYRRNEARASLLTAPISRPTPAKFPLMTLSICLFMGKVSEMKNVILILCVVVGLGSVAMAADITEQKIIASDAAERDLFGSSVSISGDSAIIGAWGNSDGGHYSGSAYIFNRDGSGSWGEIQKLTASDAASEDAFGTSVSISGNYAIIGAEGDNDAGLYTGSAYIFNRDGSGSWSQATKLTNPDGAAYDNFGHSVSISGDYAIVGVQGDDDTDSDTGSAYIFKNDGSGSWGAVQKLTASDAGWGDHFGTSVSISGDSAIVGAHHNDGGAAYIFKNDGSGSWNEVQKLTGSGGLGYSVSISGDIAIGGAWGLDQAYIFREDGSGSWNEEAKLIDPDPRSNNHFGVSVSISGDYAVIGATNDPDGEAYIFKRDGSGSWNELQTLTASRTTPGNQFGVSVSISGDNAIIGAIFTDDDGENSGSAYAYGNVPEPATISMLALGGLALVRRRFRR